VKNLFKAMILMSQLALVSGCVIAVNTSEFDEDSDSWHKRQKQNREAIAEMVLGRTQPSIEDQMGSPDFVESFQRGGEKFVVLYYRTHRTEGDGETTKDETTPLVFVDGELVGWGESAVDHATR